MLDKCKEMKLCVSTEIEIDDKTWDGLRDGCLVLG